MLERVMKRATETTRADDNLTSFNKRYDTFVNETLVVVKQMEGKHTVKKVTAPSPLVLGQRDPPNHGDIHRGQSPFHLTTNTLSNYNRHDPYS